MKKDPVFDKLVPWKMYRYKNNEDIYLFYFISIFINSKSTTYPYELEAHCVFTLRKTKFLMDHEELEELILISNALPVLCKDERYIFINE